MMGGQRQSPGLQVNDPCFLAKNKLHFLVGTLELVPGSLLQSGVLCRQQPLLLKTEIATSQNIMYFVASIYPPATPELPPHTF